MLNRIFNKEQTATLRGIITLIVMLHHFSRKVGHSYILYPFSIGGYCAVAFFFLLSGFGSYKSWERSNNPKGVLWRRISRIILPWGILLLAYEIILLVSGEFDAISFVKCCFSISLPNHVLWYPKVQLMLYCVFYIVYYHSGFGDVGKLISFFAFCLVYIALMISLGMEQYWYITTIFYPIGILLGKYLAVLETRSRKIGSVLAGTSGIAFALLFGYQFFYGNAVFGSFLDFIYAFSFCVFLFCCSLQFKCQHRGLKYIGNLSFELYLTHLLVLDLGTRLDIYQTLHWIPLSIIFVAVSLVFAYALRYVVQMVTSYMDSLWRTKGK